ncbi:MAG: histidinol-phosphate transaminase [Chloroflexi bacterium]|nr:histidinol-phosphate transaminase [Chloroflexota bacterium]
MTTVHGGFDTAELRAENLTRDQVLDFSSNINPLGPSPRVRQAAAEADLSAYPDRECLVLREALAAQLGVDTDQLMVGNGSTELIHLLARAHMPPWSTCLVFAPTFGEYEAAADATGARVKFVVSAAADGFTWSMDTAVETIATTRPAMVFLCNPNNPTGVYLDCESAERLSEAVGSGGLLVLDTSYVPLADAGWDALPLLRCGNVALLRSMTKDHALAGVRLGYMAAQPPVIEATRDLQHSWSVNAIAQAVGVAALGDEAHVAAAREVIAEAKDYLEAQLTALGVPAAPSAANFMLVRVGDATGVRQALLRRRILVRDCTSFGLPDYIRIAVRRREECVRLVAALREVLAHG